MQSVNERTSADQSNPASNSKDAFRIIKIFIASPSDLAEERIALLNTVREINDVLTFLMPEKRLSLELIRYETHAFPDIGKGAQDVINKQIPIDYDILVGLMWKRCGTATSEYKSGTIEEFWRAYEHRKRYGKPIIMFYFCEQPISLPNSEELNQLFDVVNFKEKIAHLGYTAIYPTHTDFREYVRGGLLRAVKSIIDNKHISEETIAINDTSRPVVIEEGVRNTYMQLAEEYDSVRLKMDAGGSRTRKMTAIFNAMKVQAPVVRSLLQEFERSTSAGQRLGAIAILYMFPSSDHLEWLAQRLDPDKERPFIGFQAAASLLQAARILPVSQCKNLRQAVDTARQLAERLTTDPPRIEVLKIADEELKTKCGSG